MRCWHCDTHLIWDCDHDLDNEDGYEDYCMLTNLSCPKCNSVVDVYLPRLEVNTTIENKEEEKDARD